MGKGTAAGLIALALVLALNSVLGPLALEVIRYRFSDSLLYQGIGLDLVSLVVVTPAAVAAGAWTLRGRAAGQALGLGLGAYGAYMAVQYIVGPEYLELGGNNERFFLLHLALLVLGLGTVAAAWRATDSGGLPPGSPRGARRWGTVLLAVAALLLLRYLPALAELTAGNARSLAEYRENPTSFLLIATLDLGVFLPLSAAAGLALRRGWPWARKALHLALGWFALVGLAVAAMSATMLVHGDPAASAGGTAAFAAAGIVLVGLYLRLLWPLLRTSGEGAGARGDGSRSAP